MRRRSTSVILQLLSWIAECFFAEGGPRKALLLLNTKYTNLDLLPVDDSGITWLEEALRAAHFKVDVKRDLYRDEMFEKLDDYYKTRVKSGDVSFFYYSGYLAQDPDANYLLPTDFDPASNGEVDGSSAYLFRGWRAA